MTRQPWLIKPVIDHCTGKQKGVKQHFVMKIILLIEKQPFIHNNIATLQRIWYGTSVQYNTVSKR